MVFVPMTTMTTKEAAEKVENLLQEKGINFCTDHNYMAQKCADTLL